MCLVDLFTSRKNVTFMRCGHAIHQECLDNYRMTKFTCPLCNKTLLPDQHARVYWYQVAMEIQGQPMPPECAFCVAARARACMPRHMLSLTRLSSAAQSGRR